MITIVYSLKGEDRSKVFPQDDEEVALNFYLENKGKFAVSNLYLHQFDDEGIVTITNEEYELYLLNDLEEPIFI